MKTFVIGLGGVTNGGKTTLAGKLKQLLPNCTIISQDDFFKPESEVAKDDRGFLQYDVLDALYMETMVASIRSWMTKPEDSALPRPLNNTHDDQTGAKDIRVLIIEGFLLFNYKPLSDIWDKKYFLTIPYEECKRRRSSRIYSPPDPPGYFDGHVWPMYQKHRREMEENEASIVYLDGTKPQEDLCSRIYDDIMQELEDKFIVILREHLIFPFTPKTEVSKALLCMHKPGSQTGEFHYNHLTSLMNHLRTSQPVSVDRKTVKNK